MNKPLIMAAFALLLAVSGPGFAADDTSPEAKYRHEVMEAMGKHFAAMALIATNRVNRPDQIQVHTDALAMTAALTPSLFPEGSQGGHALSVIWDEPAKVEAAAQKAVDATAALAEATRSGDRKAVMKAFRAAGESCKGCHEDYKEEDEHDH